MKSVVVMLLGLGSALAREPGEAIRDRPSWQAETSSVVLPRLAEEEESSGDLASVLAPEIGVAQGDLPNVEDGGDAGASGGQWEIACEIKSGSALVFDRASLREYGAVTLFRWSAPRTRIASPGEQIYTALVNCREKTIEASWPGRSRETYAGTCGRGLVEAVCAAAEQTSVGSSTPASVPAPGAPAPSSTRASRHRGQLPHR